MDPGRFGSGERGRTIVATQQLSGRPVIPRALFWLVVLLGVLAFAVVAFLLAAGGG